MKMRWIGMIFIATLLMGQNAGSQAEVGRPRDVGAEVGRARDVGVDISPVQADPLQSCIGYQGGEPGSLYEVRRDAGGADMVECYETQEGWVRKRDPFGAETSTIYDEQGRAQSKRGPLGETSVFTYDDRSRLQWIRQNLVDRNWIDGAEVPIKSFFYDSVGNLGRLETGSAQGGSSMNLFLMYNGDDMTDVVASTGGEGTCVAERDNEGRPTILRFDGIDTNSGECAGAAGEMHFTYDGQTGLIQSVEDPLGNTTEVLARDPMGRPTQTRLPDGSQMAVSYSAGGLLLSSALSGSNGNALSNTTYSYDDQGKMTATTSRLIAAGAPATDRTISYEYGGDANATEIAVIAPGALGQESRSIIRQDKLGRTLQEQSPLSPAKTYRYQGRTIFSRDEGLGLETKIERNVFGLTSKIVQPSGYTLAWDFDSNGMAASYFEKDTEISTGIETRYYRDVFGRARKIEKVVGDHTLPVNVVEYDANGNLISLTAKPGDVATFNYRFEYNYGPQHALSAVVDPYNRRKEFTEYDAKGNLRRMTDQRGTQWTYTYDAMGRLTRTAASMGGTTYVRSIAYNGRGDVISLTDKKGRGLFNVGCLLSRRWDDRGEPCERKITYTTDSFGHILSETQKINERNRMIRRTFTSADTVSQITYPSGTVVTYEQDNAGHTLSASVRRPAWQLRLNYNAERGRYESFNHADGTQTQLIYNRFGHWMGWNRRNAEGDLLAREQVKREQMRGVVHFRLRELGFGMMAGLPDNPGPFPDWTARQWQLYERDSFNRLVRQRNVLQREILAVGDDVLFASRGVGFSTCDGNAIRNAHCEGYQLNADYPGNLDFVYRGTFGTNQGEVRRVWHRVDGQILEVQIRRQCSRTDQCAEGPEILQYQIDDGANITQIRRGENGAELVREYFYDPWSRLIRAVIYGTPKKEIRYDYDGLNRLVRRRVFEEQVRRNWFGQESTSWQFIQGEEMVWDGNRILERRVSTNAGRADGAVTRYIYGVEASPIAAITPQNRVDEYVSGMDGSLLGIRSEHDGDEAEQDFVQWYEYGSFGEVKAYHKGEEGTEALPADVALRTPILYRGHYYDPILQFYFVGGGMWHDPVLGRYLTGGASKVSMGNMNPYVSQEDPI